MGSGRRGCRSSPIGTDRTQLGVVLVVVLWVMALLAVLAGGFARGTRTGSTLVHHQMASAKARALAEGGVQRGIQEMMRSQATRLWQPDGTVYQMAFGEGRVAISVRDESGKVDLNTAADELIGGLLKAVGVEDANRDALLDAILDWRDSDDLRRAHGAEQADYRGAGLDYGPKNGRFESVEELRSVLGMTRPLFELLQDRVTVHSQQRWVNPEVADRLVLLAIPGWDETLTEGYLALRAETPLGQAAPPPPSAPPPFVPARSRSTYSIAATGDVGGTLATVRAVVRISGSPQQPFSVLAWSDAGKPLGKGESADGDGRG
jgi:general secretion pathway protein K